MDGYTTDANYLIQGGKDIGYVTGQARLIALDFDSRSHLSAHEWSVFQPVGEAYENVRQAMLDCLTVTVETLTAYADALVDSGNTYLQLEEIQRRVIRGIQ